MNPKYQTRSLSTERYYQIIFRLNKKTGATERKRYFSGELPNSLKKDGWQAEVKKGKRVHKTN